MGLFRLLIAGAAVAAGVHYVTKKRPDGSSIADDIRSQAPEWMNKAQPYVDQLKKQFSKIVQDKPSATDTYPQKFDNPSPDPDPTYSS
jgi:hypothetical protein